MDVNTIDISKFQQDDHFYEEIDLILTVKSFDLQAIRKRYLKSKKNVSGRAGSVERREAGTGGVVQLRIEKGKIVAQKILTRMNEPRGIGCSEQCETENTIFGIASENIVYLLEGDQTKKITHPWFSYIHTISFPPSDPKKLLIASSGLDCIFEYNLDNMEQSFEWFAWENGFESAVDPNTGDEIILTRNSKLSEAITQSGKKVILVENPDKQGLPTAMRAAFINSVTYDSNSSNHMLATFFHKGMVFSIDRNSKIATPVLSGLKNPHGGMNYGTEYMATSTASGEVVIGNENKQTRYSFCHLPGKPDYLGDLEWLQTSTVINDNIITIDSNRTSLVIFNPDKGCYSKIPYDDNWAIQDMVLANISAAQIGQMMKLG